jgi:hypothetical protein
MRTRMLWDASPWSWCISWYSHHLHTSLHSHTRHQTVLRLTIQVHMQQSDGVTVRVMILWSSEDPQKTHRIHTSYINTVRNEVVDEKLLKCPPVTGSNEYITGDIQSPWPWPLPQLGLTGPIFQYFARVWMVTRAHKVLTGRWTVPIPEHIFLPIGTHSRRRRLC